MESKRLYKPLSSFLVRLLPFTRSEKLTKQTARCSRPTYRVLLAPETSHPPHNTLIKPPTSQALPPTNMSKKPIRPPTPLPFNIPCPSFPSFSSLSSFSLPSRPTSCCQLSLTTPCSVVECTSSVRVDSQRRGGPICRKHNRQLRSACERVSGWYWGDGGGSLN
jgi:hypothetical protein